jgi:hypothetical protein
MCFIIRLPPFVHVVPADARGLCTGVEEAAGSRSTAAANEKVTQQLHAYRNQPGTSGCAVTRALLLDRT